MSKFNLIETSSIPFSGEPCVVFIGIELRLDGPRHVEKDPSALKQALSSTAIASIAQYEPWQFEAGCD